LSTQNIERSANEARATELAQNTNETVREIRRMLTSIGKPQLVFGFGSRVKNFRTSANHREGLFRGKPQQLEWERPFEVLFIKGAPPSRPGMTTNSDVDLWLQTDIPTSAYPFAIHHVESDVLVDVIREDVESERYSGLDG
jgi:hypothetical protein